jgi:subtilisin-like proprotein convertase family protein
MQGNWVLRVADLAGKDVGTLNQWSLELTAGD